MATKHDGLRPVWYVGHPCVQSQKVKGETSPRKLTAQKDGQTHRVKVRRKFTANATKGEEERGSQLTFMSLFHFTLFLF